LIPAFRRASGRNAGINAISYEIKKLNKWDDQMIIATSRISPSVDYTEVMFGAGASRNTGAEAKKLGITKAVIVCDKDVKKYLLTILLPLTNIF